MSPAIMIAAALLTTPALAPRIVAPSPTTERIVVNDNRKPAGTMRNGVLTIRLEAREGEWHPDGDADPGLIVRAFAEQSGPLQTPGPLIRVREGTEIHAFVRNGLPRGTLVLRGFSKPGASTDPDTLHIARGATKEIRFTAGAPGTYYYWASVEGAPSNDKITHDSQLHGAFVVDPREPARVPDDRIFVVGLWHTNPAPGGIILRNDLLRFTINGKAWPNTERLSYALGDTVRFRVINTTPAPHPMHLHGFYFDVNSRGNGTSDSVYAPTEPPYRVVTERVGQGRTFSMTWIPERAGNWLFHCHDNFHVLRNRPLDGSPIPAEHLAHVTNHTMDMMGGLVMAIDVRGIDSSTTVAQAGVRRQLRLVARVDSVGRGTEAEPAYGYVLEERGASPRPVQGTLLPGPTIVLRRGEPVSIAVVNELAEKTSVHWHGIELDSYFDGVADFSGSGRHVASAIAPGDSFVAHFTPPRSGTFMYHPHADEVRQQQAGLSGALLVVDNPRTFDSTQDIVVLLSVPRTDVEATRTVLINGSSTPAPHELRAGKRYRFRIIDIHTFRPSMIVRVARDSALTEWRLLAKDGMDVPSERATMRPAVQQMANGEAYDFELVAGTPGELQLTVSNAVGQVLSTLPIRIR